MSDCIFCKIAAGKIPAEILGEKPSWLVVRDITSQTPIHLVVFPKEHIPRLTGKYVNGSMMFEFLGETILQVAASFADNLGLNDYRLIINNGPGAGQRVPHLHVHILGGWPEGQIPDI
jgi:histidine triad (HIT) family protein